MLVDSHCHLDCLDLTDYGGDLNKVLQAARDVGVEHILCVCIDLDNFPAVLAIAKQHAWINASVGVHPNDAAGSEAVSVAQLLDLANDAKVVAIGETGLDYYRSEGDLAWQHNRFRYHIQAAKQSNKPLIIHSRSAKEDTLRIMEAENAREIGGVMHCFTEDWDMAQRAIDLNFYISFSGIVTFKNAKQLHEVAQRVPLDRMLIETDAPYLAPVPYRGKTNQPAYVKYVAEHIAQLRDIEYAEVAAQTTQNFYRLFNVKPAIHAN